MKKICLILIGLTGLLLVLSAALVFMHNGVATGEKVAVVRVEGTIIDSKNVIDELKGYVRDAAVKAIVLRVDSPGGGVAPSQEIYEEVRKASAQKKVVVSMGSIAASGGYYISSPATRIIANPGTITGSIGVIMEIPNIQGLLNKVGVKTEVIKSGRHKDMASVFRGIGREERLIMQKVLDDVHEQFIKAVAEGRKMLPDDVRKLSDGRIFSGRQALDAGLVDELGNLEDAIKTAATLSGIKGEPEVVTGEKKFSILNLLRGKLPDEVSDLFPSVKMKYIFAP
ncbi:MAG: signal peptide peptidase SppA [Nitrospirota bacterium]